MDERLNNLYHGVAVGANADAEHIAALELLALVMASDRVAEIEIDEIKAIADDWRDDDFTFDKHVVPAIAKAKAAIEAERAIELIADIDDRISSRILRQALFSAARDVAGADRQVDADEGSILAEVAVRFG